MEAMFAFFASIASLRVVVYLTNSLRKEEG
jgi:hypothetical protein